MVTDYERLASNTMKVNQDISNLGVGTHTLGCESELLQFRGYNVSFPPFSECTTNIHIVRWHLVPQTMTLFVPHLL